MSEIPLPPSLDLSPHLSAHKYFMVCTLTVAAWDTLVLSPRNYRLLKSQGWPALKILFHFLRVLMPIEFIVVAVAFFDTNWSQDTCQHFYLFEPICTAILLAASSAVHAIRIYAIYDRSSVVGIGLGALYAAQVVVTAVCCAFYRSVPLLEGQGCIAGPKGNWVGVYWLLPTLMYTASFALALVKSFNSLQAKPMGLWKLMLRDGLNLYGAIWLVNMANMLFWFIMNPTDEKDPIKTIVTSMAAVLTTSMTLRIILSVRGTLVQGGSFALSGTATNTSSSRTTHHISTRSGVVPNNLASPQNTYDLNNIRSKAGAEPDWDSAEHTFGAPDSKANSFLPESDNHGVRITVDQQTFDSSHTRRR